MNLTREQYELIMNQIGELQLAKRVADQNIQDLVGQVDMQTRTLNTMIERIEQLVEIIEEEIG